MRFGLAIVVVVAAAAGMLMVPSCKAGTRPLADNAHITDVNVHQVAGGPQGNTSKPAARKMPKTASSTGSGRTPTGGLAAGTRSVATNVTPSGGQIPSPAKVLPQSINTSMVSNISGGTTVPPPATATKTTNTSSAPVTPQSTSPHKGMNSPSNAPRVTNVSRLPATSRSPGNSTKYPEAGSVTQGAASQQAACSQGDGNTQQNTASVEAVAGFIQGLDILNGMYTSLPGKFGLDDAEEEAPQNNTGGLQNPLEKFRMCTLITRVGDERGPLTVLVAAEDEQRMRARGSFYHVGSVYPVKQRAFTSFCPGKEAVFLTFNPSKRQ